MKASLPSSPALRPGALVWVCAVQFFVVQAIATLAWTTPFSLKENFISDLGNTECGPYPAGLATYVCSPLHAWMNASFVLQGAIILAGCFLIYRAFPKHWLRPVGMLLLATSGPGLFLVGLYPENVNLPPHKLGAGLQFVLGNLGIALLGLLLLRNGPGRRPLHGALSIVAGLAGVIATWLLVTDRFLGLGIGGMERVAAYPQPIWLTLTGLLLFRREARGGPAAGGDQESARSAADSPDRHR